MHRFLRTASLAAIALAAAAPGFAQQGNAGANKDVKEDHGVNNQQSISKPVGDPSIVQQHAGPGSHDNVQSTTTSTSPGGSPNTVVQTTEGGNNAQTAVQTGGSGNVVIQTQQQGSGNRQTVTQSGDGNRATQSQSGNGHTGTLDQHGGQTDIQIQK